jgi:hypothetical protein
MKMTAESPREITENSSEPKDAKPEFAHFTRAAIQNARIRGQKLMEYDPRAGEMKRIA